ncbi:alpha-amylase family glycosyl hydrolase [Aerococcaceae bacterium WGS1372]
MVKQTISNLKWKTKDEQFAYDGPLGPELRMNGSAILRLWSPSADQVDVIIYDKDNQDTLLGTVPMEKKDQGLWEVELTNRSIEHVSHYENYFYHYKIHRGSESVLALDPYAKSLAAWNSHDPNNYIAKAAIVKEGQFKEHLDFAHIPQYKRREDAIIYEVHVRDFTSDPGIKDELNHRFGTFEAMIDRLDYIQSLGVTHIQLLPVLSYYHANEFAIGERFLEYKSSWTNYNWGYDPMHYFALTGMYSINPENPLSRMREFKELVDAIHQRGMGVILDVVYNHTAQLHVLEDLEPEYYHFMNLDGSSRTNFGGGRLGSTHHMTRRLIIDSLRYLVEEYKVDGFRFDMMGDLDADTIQKAYDEISQINPNLLLLGEGWITYVGDEGEEYIEPADQHWMEYTEAVASFSDDIRNELKSGFQSEGKPRFITGGKRRIQRIF